MILYAETEKRSFPSIPKRLHSSTMKFLVIMMVAATILETAKGQNGKSEGSVRPTCSGPLRWVPLITKKPFTTLMNSAYCPSWMTRHLMSKQSQTTHLALPLKVPVAFFCGFCTHPTSVETNLTLSHNIAGVQQDVAQASVKSSTGEEKHESRGHHCKVQFAVTGPITGSYGSLECTVNYGVRTLKETATYTAYDAEIVTTEEIIDVPGNTALLSCPPHPDEPTESNPLVHVWYYPLATGPRVAAPTTNPMVTFRLAFGKELVVSCATYHLLRVSSVVVKTYKVSMSESYQLQGDAIISVGDRRRGWDTEKSYGAYGDSVENEDARYSTVSAAGLDLSMVVVAIVSAVGAVLTVFAGIAVIRCMRRRNDRGLRR
ncbi:uncharacterized protein LOC108669027 [Hyalella azteca]|uniref:Uncharacterized protein LOC108669027 n=1 Tax=Hyalella azteca TaxID=294128 RepID=A0A8B7NDW9_HYAAZ|nr:uncharacterized protein LOC108669027 [Hyalella azteca]